MKLLQPQKPHWESMQVCLWLSYNYTESSSSHQCVGILSCHLICCNCFYLQELFFLFTAIILCLQQRFLFKLQQLFFICSNFFICSMSPVGHRKRSTSSVHFNIYEWCTCTYWITMCVIYFCFSLFQ